MKHVQDIRRHRSVGTAFQVQQVETDTVHGIDEQQAPSGLSRKYCRRENWMGLGMDDEEWQCKALVKQGSLVPIFSGKPTKPRKFRPPV